jgi:hypothetical protein
MAKSEGWPPAAPGARRIFDRWAWVREFTKPGGPDSVTRLVLFTMASKMDEDGTRCTLGERGLARMTGLCKATAAKYRRLAIEQGWLLPPTAGHHASKQEWLPSVPASSHCPNSADTTGSPALPYGIGQQQDNSLPYTVTFTALHGDVHCPTPSGIPASYQPYNQPRVAPARDTRAPRRTPNPEPGEPPEVREARKLLEVAAALGWEQKPDESERQFMTRIRALNRVRLGEIT